MNSLRAGFTVVMLVAAFAAAETHWVTTAEEFNALPVLNAGDRVVLQDGTYGELNTTLQSSITNDAVAQTNPIVIYAQSPGGAQVVLPSAISLEGSGIVLAGLDFGVGSGMIDNGSTDPAAIIRTEPDSRYITLSNLRFKNCTDGDDYGSWLSIAGFNHTIEYCSFEGKDDPIANATVVFRRNLYEAGPTVPRNHVLRRCYFGPRQVSATDNGYETIRIGDSGSQIYQLSVTIEENVFYRSIWRDDGESGNDTEIISNKSTDNTIRNNTFLESYGQITLRHGDHVTVEGNWIFGGGAYTNGGIEIVSTNVHQSGVRVIGQDHIVRNNYFKNLHGDDLRAALCVMAGFSDFDDGDGTTGDNRYEAAHNAQIFNNRFADCRQISLGYVKDSADEQPAGVAMISNIWQSTDSDDAIIRDPDFEIGTSASNIIYESGGDFGWTGLTNSTYTTTEFPDIGNYTDQIPNIGSSPLLRDEVGPLFAGGPAGTYPVSTDGLDPNVPPSGNFDMTQWYLQLPVDATNGFDGEARIVEAPELTAGFELEPWFYTATNGALAFAVPWNGALKGTSLSPRCELRETYSDGELRNWTPLEDGGVHTLSAVCSVNSVGDGKVAIGQIHGKVPDVPTVIMRYDNTVDPAQIAVSVYNTADGLTGKTWLYYDAPALGDEIAYQMDLLAVSNTVSFFCTVNGETQSVALTNDVPGWLDATFYFKAGAYYTTIATGETAEVFFSELELTRGEGLQVSTAVLPNGVTSVPYFQTLEKTGVGFAVWSLNSGSLPDGLSLNTNGIISGTPLTNQVSLFRVYAQSASSADFQDLSLAVDASVSPSLAARSVLAVSASADDGNGPENTLDGSLDTRWSAEGAGQWILYDLGVPQSLHELGVAWYKGDQRTSEFSVELSLDGQAWKTIIAQQSSSGSTNGLETIDFENTSGRYLRITGYGNSDSDWNSITETQILGISSGLSEPMVTSFDGTILSVPALYGAVYQLQKTDSLVPVDWQDVGSAQIGAGDPLNWSAETTNTAGFYRLIALP